MRFVLRTLSPVRVAASLSSIKTDPEIFIISADRPLVCAVFLSREVWGGHWAVGTLIYSKTFIKIDFTILVY